MKAWEVVWGALNLWVVVDRHWRFHGSRRLRPTSEQPLLMVVSVLQGVLGAAAVIWTLGCVVLVHSKDVRRRWRIPFWPLIVTDEFLSWRAKKRRQRAMLDAMKRK